MTHAYEDVELLPDPSRVIEGLRDTGYDFNTALADIVDNSIAAAATVVDIFVTPRKDGELLVAIADNGCGMNRDELMNAMRYGSSRRAHAQSLGKFGMGLKTASTSCCRRLSVVSRNSASAAPIKATWDIDHVVRTGKWNLLVAAPERYELELLDRTASGSAGTLVLWEKCDRVLRKEYKNPTGAPARKALDDVVEKFRFHAALTFQRFLDPTFTGVPKVTITLNGRPVEPWDPFCAAHECTEMLAQEERVEVELPDGTVSAFKITAWMIPASDQFEDKKQAKDARINDEMQGFYIYRENRLIHCGGWLGTYNKEFHYRLLRVDFSFDYTLDDAFHVDIKKSRVDLDPNLRDWLRDKFLPAPRKAADDRYRGQRKRKIGEQGNTAHELANRAIAGLEQGLRQSEVTVVNSETGEVDVQNRQGTVRLKLYVSNTPAPEAVVVEPAASIDDGLLWEPCILNQRHGVRLNQGHPYYQKVYVPNYSSSVTVQGLDSLMWAMCEAELGCIDEKTRKNFRELRYEVSKLLREMVEDMPDPVLDA